MEQGAVSGKRGSRSERMPPQLHGLHVEHLGASWCFTNRGQPPRVRSAPPGWTEAARPSPRTRRAAAPPPCHHHSERQTCAHRVETVGRGGGGWLAHVEKEMFEWVGMHGVDEPIFTILRSKRLKRDTMENVYTAPQHRITRVVGRAVRGGNAWCRRPRGYAYCAPNV